MGACLPRERAEPELEGGGALGGSEGFLGPCREGRDSGIEPRSPKLQEDSLPSEPPGKLGAIKPQ